MPPWWTSVLRMLTIVSMCGGCQPSVICLTSGNAKFCDTSTSSSKYCLKLSGKALAALSPLVSLSGDFPDHDAILRERARARENAPLSARTRALVRA